jgi:hypothetical protein
MTRHSNQYITPPLRIGCFHPQILESAGSRPAANRTERRTTSAKYQENKRVHRRASSCGIDYGETGRLRDFGNTVRRLAALQARTRQCMLQKRCADLQERPSAAPLKKLGLDCLGFAKDRRSFHTFGLCPAHASTVAAQSRRLDSTHRPGAMELPGRHLRKQPLGGLR